MLEFVPNEVRRIALSPSFGIPTIPANLRNEYKRDCHISNICQSERKSGCEIVSDLGFKNPCWTLDPTLIMPEEKWQALADESNCNIDESIYFAISLDHIQRDEKEQQS